MGLRFHKTIKLGPLNINLSKSGVGFSVGTKGARVGRTAKGNYRTTLGIPGTGISYVKETSGKKKNTKKTSTSTKTKKSNSSDDFNISDLLK